jgi:hypothetical protein
MQLPPFFRKLGLTAHVIASVGWLGAAAAFLALAIIGLTSNDPQTVRGVYLVMDPAARYLLVPLAFTSLLTGIVQSLGTTWGLLRHYWVIFKLIITAFATLVLLTYLPTLHAMARSAADPAVALPLVRNPSPALHAGLGMLALIVATVLAIYKPRGMTRRASR